MIWESYHWKEDLLKRADRLSQRSKQKRWPEVSLVHVEQNIMMGFYAIRKLTEARKVSDRIADQQIRLKAYKWNKKKNVTRMNWHRIDELYDLDKEHRQNRTLRYLCNQFIHSYVFILHFKGNHRGLDGILVSSENERHKYLYLVAISQIIRLFRQFGNDYPNISVGMYDPQKRDFDVKLITHK